MTPKLTVIGAGIGDPELITIKAVRALQTAAVILYDALVDESLLGYACPGTVRVFVGKRRGHKACEQDAINALIVRYAESHGHVVRLKGGDPFVFGRGLEEMQYARAHGLEVAYVPGVSSAIAAAGAAGIAVTLRGVSRSFWVLTATTDSGDLNPELFEAARSNATVVVLMGLSKLADIAFAFATLGRADVPVAIVQNGAAADQQVVVGTAGTIVSRAGEARLGSPAVIVIGEVVRHRLDASAAQPDQELIDIQNLLKSSLAAA
jgi:uroporphyrin-III C-methyltransferase